MVDPTRASLSCNLCGEVFQEEGDPHDVTHNEGCPDTCHVVASTVAANKHSEEKHTPEEHQEFANKEPA